MILRGDIVTIKPEYCEAGEDSLTYVARTDEEQGRFDMSAVEQAGWTLWPCQVTRSFMVEPTGQRIANLPPRGR